MRTLWTAVIALSLASRVSEARAGAPTTMFVHNLGQETTRVQVALGSVAPCDSPDNRLMFDDVVLAGEWRALSLAKAVVACVCETRRPGRVWTGDLRVGSLAAFAAADWAAGDSAGLTRRSP